jgi:phage shock protein A
MEVVRMDSEVRDMLTAVLEGQQFFGAKLEALSTKLEAHTADTTAKFAALSTQFEALSTKLEAHCTDTEAKFEALSTQMEASDADTHARLDVLSVQTMGVKGELTEVSERLRYLTHKTAELEQDMVLVKKRP